MFLHPSYLLVIPGILLMMWAQHRVKATYERYARVRSSLGMTGADVARTILNRMGVDDVSVQVVRGTLTDHYDPSAKAVRLSEGVYGSSSLSAAAIAAHECGHVLQDKHGYQFMNLRASLVPMANLGSNFGPFLASIGFMLAFFGSTFGEVVLLAGIAFFAAAILFHIVTLPVEFDASRRALQLIDDLGILQGSENDGAKAVLQAAAWTYVASALVALLQLAQYIIQYMLVADDR